MRAKIEPESESHILVCLPVLFKFLIMNIDIFYPCVDIIGESIDIETTTPVT